MPQKALTGSRIREHRLIAGIKQADLAKTIGISATYLNLIEHNRRRIGGKLLTDISSALSLDPALLADGAEAEIVGSLREAVAAMPDMRAEVDRTEDLAARYPGWAGLLAAQHKRIVDLEQVVETLTDRLAHDPELAASLHDVLTTATAIGSAASILTETKEIETEWRDRFHRNIHEDSQRLAASSQALVSYLEGPGAADPRAQSPEEELDAWLSACDHHIAGLERKLPLTDEILFAEGPGLKGDEARALASAIFARYRADVAAMPFAEFETAAARADYNPAALAEEFGVGLAAVFRRLASLPRPAGRGGIGLVICDSSGALTYRKPLGGFAMPRYGGACPNWPLYQALSRPMVPIRALIETTGRDSTRYISYAIAEPLGSQVFDAPQVYEATMLILPRDRVTLPELPVQVVGTNCRVLPCPACQARRAARVTNTATGA